MLRYDTNKLVLDAHVHLYECFDLTKLLDNAFEHYLRILQQHHLPSASTGFCLLCVDLQDRSFEASLERLSALADYELRPAGDEPFSRTLVQRDTGESLQIVWGYQIIARENLEVLAFGLHTPIDNGTPLDEIVTQLTSTQFGILPWGFGKWSAKRGQIVTQLLDNLYSSASEVQLWVGDNGGRLAMSSMPSQIQHAVRHKRWNICGSDPLPFPKQVIKVGGTGVILDGPYHASEPLASVRQLLVGTDQQPQVFGSGENLLTFGGAQIGMQIRKHSPFG